MFLSLTYALDPPESEGVLMKLQPRKPVTAQSILQLQLDDKLSYFAKMMAPSEKEVLVDSGLLCWSYLEAGTIEAVGCFSCYFFAMWWHFGVTPYDAIQYGQVWEASEYIELSNGYLLVQFI